MNRLRDLRAYIDALKDLGDLTEITEPVDEVLELGALVRRTTETCGPARLFTSVQGAAPGFRALGAPAALSSLPGKRMARVALGLGLPATATLREIVEVITDGLDKTPIAPQLIDDAPVFQNTLDGERATLDRFPTPLLHQDDGGRYVNTYGTLIVRTPDGSLTNWSIARIMQIDGRHMSGIVGPQQHLGMIWHEWAKLGKPMPFALVQGPEPAVSVISGTPLPTGVPEGPYLGGYFGEPIEVVRCRTSDLEVPASAEILIEGHVSPHRDFDEGPMGEFPGYMPRGTTRQPTYTIEAISHRDDPIWPVVAEGYPTDEYHSVTGTGNAVSALAGLRKAGLPVATALMPFEAANHVLVVTALADWRARMPGVSSIEFARRVGRVLDTVHGRTKIPKTYLLDDDFDPSDPSQLLWALATRVHPADRRVIREGRILNLLTCFTAEETANGHGALAIHDALRPEDPEGLCTFASAYPEHIRRRVLDLETRYPAPTASH
ncbi:UbiD family decarboxylase [Streptomyces gamaensis]|uniref:Pyrrole-2-carboxylic acid decarboxylase n=1 Tax=Streptomyces gamaensis TaxID=1763542 RepID=A0ABW0YZL9_9ACTN